MATATRNQVNLDALIPRADLFAISDIAKADSRSIKITDLKPGIIYSLLRKPDFQRETSNWSPQQVAALIETFSKSDITAVPQNQGSIRSAYSTASCYCKARSS